MPSFRECIVKAHKGKLINDTQRDEMLSMFDDKLEMFSKTLAESEATQAASNATFKLLKKQTKTKAIENTISVKKLNDLKKIISEYKNINEEVDISQGFRAIHGKAEGKRIVQNLEIRQRTVFGSLTKNLSDLMEAYAMPLVRRYKRANPKALVDEMFNPSSTGNKGAEIMAKALTETFEKARVLLAKQGVLVNKDPNWKFPQSHNIRAIEKSKIGKQGWVDYIKPLLDKSKMVDDKTGLTFDLLPEAEFTKALQASHRNIMTDGLGKGKKTGLKKFQESRFLIFKDADSFYSYNERFGSDPVQMVYEQLDVMSRAIAETQLFGPKPNVVRNTLKQFVLEETDKTVDGLKRKRIGGVIPRSKERGRVNTFLKKADLEYDLFVGRGHLSVDGVAAKIGSDVRNVLTGSLLGGSGITVLFGDLATTFNNAAVRGWSPFKAVVNSLGEQFTGKQGRQDAAYLGIILDDLIQNNMALSRFMDDSDSGGLAKVYATSLLRLGGVSRFTQQARNAGAKFILSDSGIGQYTKHSFDELVSLSKGKFNQYGKTVKLLQTYGITKSEWDIIRTTKKHNPRGNLKFIDPGEIAARTDIDENLAGDIASKFMDMVLTEQDHMVVVNSLRQQASTSVAPRGTVIGELGLSAFMFKSFPINVIIHNIQRAFSVPPGALNKTTYATTLLSGMVLTAAATMLTYDLIGGRDPRRVVDKKFWIEAIARSGAFGPVGDAVLGKPDARHFGELASGPVVSLLKDTYGITLGPLLAMGTDQEYNYGGKVSKFVKSWSPKPWYAKLILQRYVFDQLDKQLNDNHYSRQSRLDQYVYERGSDYWWRPDELSPERLPKFSQ